MKTPAHTHQACATARVDLLTESELAAAWRHANFSQVADLVVKHYGADIMSFLTAKLRSWELGREAYSIFLEDLLSGIQSFRWQCSMRGWSYVLARNAAHKLVAVRARQGRVERVTPDIPDRSQRTRTVTPDYMRTEVKTKMRQLRARLSADELEMLILRVDRGLSWRELAMTLRTDSDPPDLRECEVRLRKRFERLKKRLRAMARSEGLLA